LILFLLLCVRRDLHCDIYGREAVESAKFADDVWEQFGMNKYAVSKLNAKKHIFFTICPDDPTWNFYNYFDKPRFKNKIKYVGGGRRLRLAQDIVLRLFANAKSAANHLKSLFELPEFREVTTVMMIGEYSKSLMLQEWVKELLPDKQVIATKPYAAEKANGAIMYGENPFPIRKTTTENGNTTVNLFLAHLSTKCSG